jgi:ribosomal 50S subunit-recycling heat shock protein
LQSSKNVRLDAEVRISLDPQTQEVSITSCGVSSISYFTTTTTKMDDKEFFPVSCVTKWKGKFK